MNDTHFNIKGQLVDIIQNDIYPVSISVKDGCIAAIERTADAPKVYIMPGFIDAHVHIESSLLVPTEFARMAVVHGTVATVSDPHEIANVCGMQGVRYMIENGKQVNFKFYFGAPSCVPATTFETAGGSIGLKDIETLLQDPEINYLAEMMNWPGVLASDPLVEQKLALAKKYGKPIDGHAPGLRGEKAAQYVLSGISTDHECVSYTEALEKLKLGMKIAIREGSAAKNFDALIDLMDDYSENLMFCSDDKHPDSLLEGHINTLVARAVAKGKDIFDVLKVACLNPIEHYSLEVGSLQLNDPADFILVKDLKHFEVLQTYINGKLVASNGQTLISSVKNITINKFLIPEVTSDSFQIHGNSGETRIIEVEDGQLVTKEGEAFMIAEEGNLVADIGRDILKIAVINRYETRPVALGFIKNFGIKNGAIASSVAHDSHNIIVVGTDDESMKTAANAVIVSKGGLAAFDGTDVRTLPLPVAGLMTTGDGFEVAKSYTELDKFSKKMGATLASPYMSLSFMALLVIPSLKISDLGLFDGERFEFVPLHKSDDV
ncbi:adenine deaminase [Lunatibacter salilacus]|uniref:adenine deaminase n=1 Tax=Lunatibacter salilacus TaxID=2483804 RepID=UPI00131C6EB2|nr:adenine deaminase [Lunatibacter salilacus]